MEKTIVIDILHPQHCWIWRSFIQEMEKKGHKIIVTSRDKEMTTYLLDHFNIKHTCLSKQGKGKLNLMKEFLLHL